MTNEVAIIQETNMATLDRMADAFAKSGMFGMKTREQALALMLIAQSEGRHPASAAQDYHIINNTPSKKAESMLKDFQRNGGVVEWHELSDKRAEATFSHPSGGSVKIDWDLARAKQAGLNNQNWTKYPRAMLRSRVVSEGVRTVYPAATSGMYVKEEVEDFELVKPSKPAPPKDAIDVESTPVKKALPPEVALDIIPDFGQPLEDDHPVLVKAREEAMKGTDAFREFWKQNKHVHKDLKPHLDELKEVAAMADAQVSRTFDQAKQKNINELKRQTKDAA